MCGIVGYVGDKDAVPIVMDGLRRLEYRGYDSAGVAVAVDGHLELRRAEGKLGNLDRVLVDRPASGTLGIGHTRWATHGRPNETNAHPHLDCDGVTAVIHNGIVENYKDLKDALIQKGHTFRSETDTEVIVHLVEDGLRAKQSFDDAARAALNRIEGAAAVVLVSAADPRTIVAARISNAGGVIVGYGQGENFVASDIPALLEHTRSFSFLDHGEIAIVRPDAVRFMRLDGTAIEKPRTNVAFDVVSAAKGGYKHFMLKEIFEQPRAISDALLARVDRANSRVVFDEDVKMTDAEAHAVTRVSIVACGTSYHAGVAGKYLIERLAGIPTDVELASEYRYREPAVVPGQVTLALTQSGETVDTLAAMEQALATNDQVRALAHRYYASRDFLHLGRGLNYATALEGALKLKELSYAHAEGTAAGEMKHGTNALIDENLPVLAIAPRDSVRRKMLSNIEEVRARAGIVVALANADDEEVRSKADEVIPLPPSHELVSPVVAV